MSWEGYKFNNEGEMIPVTVYLIWGAPASGKTTYVKQHMQDGDMVVDLDLIKQSLSMMSKTDTWDTLLEVVLSIREHLYDLIEKRRVKSDVWVISGLPERDKREEVIKKIKADKVIHIKATEKECIERAKNDIERTDKQKQMQIIHKWFNKYYGF